MGRRRAFVGLILALALTLSGAAGAAEDADKPRVRSEKVGADAFALLAENPYPWPAWVTVRLTAVRNMRADRPMPLRAQLPPRARRLRLATLRRRGPGRYSFRFRFDRYSGDPEPAHDDAALYAFPFAHGTKRRIGQGYDGGLSHRAATEYAVDFVMPQGTAVHAARAGTVVKVVEDRTAEGLPPRSQDAGNHVWVLHQDGTLATYGHLRPGGVLVEPGRRVEVGALLARSGNTGASSGPHLHFQVSDGTGQSLPVRFLRHDGRALPGRDLRKGQWVYACHPGGPEFAAELGEELDAATLRGTRAPAPATGRVELEYETVDETVLLYGVNGRGSPVRLDLDLTLDNMRAASPGPHRFALPARTREFLTLLRPVDSGERWSWRYRFRYEPQKKKNG